MIGIVLAGGTGTRLLPMTKVTNKHLLPVYDKPMIYYPIDTILKTGIRDIIIVTGKEHAGNFLQLLASGSEFGAHFAYVLQEGAGGIAEAISLTEQITKGEKLLVVLGDNIVVDDLSETVKSFKKGCTIFLKETPTPERFGVPEFSSDGKILNIIEKPTKPPSKYAVTGVYIYDETVFEKIRTLKPSNRGELEVTDLNNLYLKEGNLRYKMIEGPWIDAGSVENLYAASSLIRSLKG